MDLQPYVVGVGSIVCSLETKEGRPEGRPSWCYVVDRDYTADQSASAAPSASPPEHAAPEESPPKKVPAPGLLETSLM